MKECCVLLAPQKEIADIADEECRKRDWPCKVIYCVNNNVAVELAKKSRENGVRIFISRGGMAKAVEREAGLTVIPIEIGFQDIAEAVTQAKALGNKIGISINSSLSYDLDRIRHLFSVELETISPPPGGLLIDAIQRARHQGFDVIVGGVAPVYFAQQEGLKTVSLRSGRLSVLSAIEKALVRAKENYGLGVFQNFHEGIVVLDQRNDILYINDSACRMLAVERIALINKKLPEGLPMLPVEGREEGAQQIYTAFTFKKKAFLQQCQ